METDIPIQPGLFRVIRILRIGRLLRFFEGAKGVRQLIFTIIKSAPALSNVGTLLFLIIFIYAIIGMTLFGHVTYSTYINPVVNFQTFVSSMCVLFRVATAAGWNGVLEGISIEPPFCDPNKVIPGGGGGVTMGDCGHKVAAVIYLVTYMLFIVQFIVNMYIAVILENFNDAQNQEDVGITEDAIEDYYDTWKEFDPKAKQFISYKDLSDFLAKVQRPFRIPKPNDNFISRTGCPVREGYKIHCLDLLQVLIKEIIGEDKCEVDDMVEKVMGKLDKKFKKQYPIRLKKKMIATAAEQYAVETEATRHIQRLARWYLIMSNVRSLIEEQSDSDDSLDADTKMRRVEDSLKGLIKMRDLARERVALEEEKRRMLMDDEDLDSYNYDDDDDDEVMETPLL